MSASTLGPLNNANLVEAFTPAATYNALALIDVCKLEPLKHRAAHTELLNLISARGLSDTFSIHLVHKHFDVPEGQVMHARDPKKVSGLRGLYFRTTPDGKKMTAYEYTTEPAKDLSAHEDFAAEYAATATRLGVGHIFALGAEGIASIEKPQSEFELASHSSTVVVDAEALPDLNNMKSTSTGWVPTTQAHGRVYGGVGEFGVVIFPEVPGVLVGHCIEDRVGNHNNHGKRGAGPVVETRQSMPGMSHDTGAEDVTLHPGVSVGGIFVEKDSLIYDVLDRAVAQIGAY
ncbi:Uu.00g041620.m01.CDS01 [Anthostomella pinea]|uniref:Uu.00g041620.m01.CDS01 n=1 Tax=Anthostomella pinea TaxID=933095 RepID=A0AAI8VAA5_9PEZI|nr:Uu.00g041620.m01.CDS01 [Anthostomella pinea]